MSAPLPAGFPTPPGPFGPPPVAGYAQPVVSRRELRPGRWWYWVAAVLGLAGAVAAAVSFFQGITQVIQFGPIDRFEIGEEATFEIDPDDPHAVYALERDDLSIPFVDCSAFAEDGGSVDLVAPRYEGYITNGDGSWVSIYDIEVSGRGRYTFECDGFPGFRPGDAIGLGPQIDPAAFASRVGLAGLFALVGLGGALVIGLIVSIRRSGHKRRLTVERQPPAPPMPPGWAPWGPWAGWYTPPGYPPPAGPGSPPPPGPVPPPSPPPDFAPPG